MHRHPASDRPALRTAVTFALLAALSGCIWDRESPSLKDKDVRLTILHTSDIHSRLFPYDLAPLKTDRDLGLIPQAAPFGGAARLAALVKRERSLAERSILVDSGDCFQGAPIFNLNDGEAEIRFLSLLRPDAVVIGNHEFDSGTLNLARQVEMWGTYPLLAANYAFTTPNIEDPSEGLLGRVTQPYTIVNADGLRIAVIGMANLSSLNSIVEGGNSMGITPLEQNETVRAYVEFLEPQVDFIVLLTHLGHHEDQEVIQGYETVYERKRIEQFLHRTRHPWRVVEEWTDDDGTEKVLVHIPGVSGIDVIMGGHLHVVLNPPQVLKDVDGRDVIVSHSGAFTKYLGRLDLVIRNGEVQAHKYRVFPIDSLWCIDPELRDNMPPFGQAEYVEELLSRYKDECAATEDARTHRLLDYYAMQQGLDLQLPMIFAYAPRMVPRHSSSGSGDSPLGNLTADAMRRRQRVEAEFAITNTLGIRDNMYGGPVSLEGMFNIFPFENTITIMYLSGVEVQELFNFMAERSAGRGCQSQGQISGARFVMDCGRALENERNIGNPEMRCTADSECRQKAMDRGASSEAASEWLCRQEYCYRHPAHSIFINEEPINPLAAYKMATNDYIAKGGSGFRVLRRNTTRIDTGISLRDALIDSLRKMCTCEELDRANEVSLKPRQSRSQQERELVARCGVMFGGLARTPSTEESIPPQCREVRQPGPCRAAFTWCDKARTFADGLAELEERGTPPTSADWRELGQRAWIDAGKCGCHQVLAHDHAACGHTTDSLEAFCRSPLRYPVVATEEDGRIGRRVK